MNHEIIKMNKDISIYIVHGIIATSQSNWYPWLERKVSEKGIFIKTLNMPNSDQPILHEWMEYLNKELSSLNENTILIGHSLGCVAILNYLNSQKNLKIKAAIWVSGFIEKTPISQVQEFVDVQLNYQKINKQIQYQIAITAKDDDIIPYTYTKEMETKLDINTFVLETGKHFIDRDRYTTFPFLLDQIDNIVKY